MKNLLTPLLLACSVLCLAGCSGFTQGATAIGLSVEVTGVNRAADGAVEVSFRLDNPNIVPYLLAETTHRIFLNGTLIGIHRNLQAVALPAQTKLEGMARLIPEGPAAVRAVNDAVAAGSASYRTETALLIRLYGETTDKGTLVGTGTVAVTAK
jgi:hypothetical protein